MSRKHLLLLLACAFFGLGIASPFGTASPPCWAKHGTCPKTTGTVTSITTDTSTPTTPVPSATAYLVDGFEASLPGIWNETAASASLIASTMGETGQGAELTVVPTSGAQSELTSLWLANGDPRIHDQPGDDTWYRVDVDFRTGVYTPTTGEWNWLVEWHNDGACSTAGAVSTAVGVYTDFPVVAGAAGQNPRLALRLGGGSCTAPTYATFALPAGSLMFDHWYTLLIHIVWSQTGGRADWFVDGTSEGSTSFPTLYTNPDGTADQPAFGLYNYRLDDPVHVSGVDFDNVMVGPTQASVSG